MEVALPVGHKLAAQSLRCGDPVRKCGAVIGQASADVGVGQYLHLHNVRSNYLAAHLVGGASTGDLKPGFRPLRHGSGRRDPPPSPLLHHRTRPMPVITSAAGRE